MWAVSFLVNSLNAAGVGDLDVLVVVFFMLRIRPGELSFLLFVLLWSSILLSCAFWCGDVPHSAGREEQFFPALVLSWLLMALRLCGLWDSH